MATTNSGNDQDDEGSYYYCSCVNIIIVVSSTPVTNITIKAQHPFCLDTSGVKIYLFLVLYSVALLTYIVDEF